MARRILLGVSGGIAAYKATSIITGLRKAGHEVNVVMTQAATKFITPFTLESLSARPVYSDMFSPSRQSGVEHVQLARTSDLFLIAPCTANVIGKLAHGIADDFLTTVALAVTCPVVICPAMEHHMYNHPVVQENMKILEARGYYIIEPEQGRLASGAQGTGRLPEPEAILKKIGERVPGWQGYLKENQSNEAATTEGDQLRSGSLVGRRVLVTAGPTREYLDPVRYLSNPSSGRMGYEIAQAAQEQGAEVILVSGPTELAPPDGVDIVSVVSAAEMANEVLARFEEVDVVVSAAAVADYTPAVRHEHKLKKQASGDELTITFRRTTDILKQLGQTKRNQLLVGFAAESQDVLANAQAKMLRKNADIMIVNDVTQPGAGFAHETNQVTVIGPGESVEQLPLMSKRNVAKNIVRHIMRHLD